MLNIYFKTVQLAKFPMLITIGIDVFIVNINGNSVTNSLSLECLSVSQLTSNQNQYNFAAVIDQTDASRLRFKINAIEANNISIKLLRTGYPIVGAYYATS